MGNSSASSVSFAFMPPSWTLCAMSRYVVAGSTSRILQGTDTNVVFGHWAGSGGVFYQVSNWRSPSSYPAGTAFSSTSFSPLRWLAFCVSSDSLGPIIVNGVDVRYRGPAPVPPAPSAMFCLLTRGVSL